MVILAWLSTFGLKYVTTVEKIRIKKEFKERSFYDKVNAL